MKETPAHKVKGFLLRGIDGELFFRIYDKDDRRKYKDYEIRHYDLEVEIVDNYSSIFEEETTEGFDGYISYRTNHGKREKHKLGR
jgi:hypothetical protein